MTVKRTLGAEAAEKDGMTLDELALFIEEAKAAGVPGEARPTAVVKLGSARIKKIQIKG
jgi:hypothetical protein